MIRIGIICPSEIAFRRFMPALQQCEHFKYVGIAISSPREWFGDNLSTVSKEQIMGMTERELSKAQKFHNIYGGQIFESYELLVKSDQIDAVYIPLPPALHYKWAIMALSNDKHVFIEKPSTTSYEDTRTLVELARQNHLAIHENYMFVYHDQLKALDEVVKSDTIGDVRLYRITFGFPRRAAGDFRYIKGLGGGALLDAGGYTIKYARYLLGASARMVCANMQYIPDFDVEIGGSATMVNKDGECAQLAFGMDNDYRCSIEIWGSKGTITSDRILTAPAGFEPEYVLKQNKECTVHKLPADDAFLKSMQVFEHCIHNDEARMNEYEQLLTQGKLVDDFYRLSK